MAALRKTPNPTFRAPVDISVPGQKPVRIHVTFRHKKKSEYLDWLQRGQEDGANDVDLFDEVIDSWGDDYVDDDGKPIPYSRAALEELFDTYPAAADNFFRGFSNALRDTRAKN